MLDNECPEKLKEHFRSRGISFQFVPPHLHQINAAKRSIDTFKDHFISGLASANPSFPIHLLYRLLPQATKTLNLLQPSRTNPRLSAEAILNGELNYNRNPLAPPGTKLIVHEVPLVRQAWALHGADGWYLGPAPKCYQCHQCYITKTRAKRIARTVEFFHISTICQKHPPPMHSEMRPRN